MQSLPMLVGAALLAGGGLSGYFLARHQQPQFSIVNSRLPVRFENATGRAWVLHGTKWKAVTDEPARIDPDLDLEPIVPSGPQP